MRSTKLAIYDRNFTVILKVIKMQLFLIHFWLGTYLSRVRLSFRSCQYITEASRGPRSCRRPTSRWVVVVKRPYWPYLPRTASGGNPTSKAERIPAHAILSNGETETEIIRDEQMVLV